MAVDGEPVEPTQVGNIYTGGGLPLGYGDLDAIYEPPAGMNIRLLDLGTVDSAPAAVLAEWDETSPRGPGRYRTVRWDGSGWQPMDVRRYAGEPFWSASYYLGGAVFDDGDLVTSSEAGGTWTVDRWSWSEPLWAHEAIVDQHATAPLVRPYPVRDGDGLVVQRLNSFVDYLTYDVDLLVD